VLYVNVNVSVEELWNLRVFAIIVEREIMAVEVRLSGGQANTAPNGSLGGQRSDTVIVDDTVENLFDNIPRAEALVGRIEFRCLYIYNTGGGHVSGAVAEITVNPAKTQMSIGLDPNERGDGRTFGIANSIGAEDTAPANVKFFGEENTSDGNFGVAYDTVKIPLGLLKANEGQAIWFKRQTEISAQLTVSVTIVVTHDAVTLPGDTVDDGGAIAESILIANVPQDGYKIGTMRVAMCVLG